MRLASVVNQANRPTRARHDAGLSSAMADSTRKKSRCFAVCLGCCCCYGYRASGSERDQAEQDRFHLVNATHPAINAQPAEPLTGTYNNLSKRLRGNPGCSIPVFTRFPTLHFNLFRLLHRRYTLQTLVYQGCSTLTTWTQLIVQIDRSHALDAKALRVPPNPPTL